MQHMIEDALGKVTRCSREQLQLAASGRTDAGVHAWGQVDSFVLFARTVVSRWFTCMSLFCCSVHACENTFTFFGNEELVWSEIF